MQTFSEVMDYLEQQISELNPSQMQQISRNIVDDFLQKLPKDWEKTELECEQPMYVILADLLKQADWDFEAIKEPLKALDSIVEEMGDEYPADTDFLPITLLNMVFFIQQIYHSKRRSKKLTLAFLNLIEQYLSVADYFADRAGVDSDENFQIQDDKWLSYPLIRQAFEQLEDWVGNA